MTASLHKQAQPRLSFIIPAYNEEALLADTVQQLHRVLAQLQQPSEIVIVNDGSVDRTGSIADTLSASLNQVRAVHQTNQGIGGAFRAGASLAAGDYLMLWPADMRPEAPDLTPYLSALGQADAIIGCRRQRVGYNPVMLLNAWLYPKIVSVLFGLHLRDVNWIHAYRRELFLKLHLTQRGIPMLAETLVRLRDARARFIEIEVDMRLRTAGKPSAGQVSVMLRTLRGLFTFWLTWRRELRLTSRTTI